MKKVFFVVLLNLQALHATPIDIKWYIEQEQIKLKSQQQEMLYPSPAKLQSILKDALNALNSLKYLNQDSDLSRNAGPVPPEAEIAMKREQELRKKIREDILINLNLEPNEEKNQSFEKTLKEQCTFLDCYIAKIREDILINLNLEPNEEKNQSFEKKLKAQSTFLDSNIAETFTHRPARLRTIGNVNQEEEVLSLISHQPEDLTFIENSPSIEDSTFAAIHPKNPLSPFK